MTPGFTAADYNAMYDRFKANLNVEFCGAVCAAPSGGSFDYYYHWMRDGALSIHVWMDINDNDYNTASTLCD